MPRQNCPKVPKNPYKHCGRQLPKGQNVFGISGSLIIYRPCENACPTTPQVTPRERVRSSKIPFAESVSPLTEQPYHFCPLLPCTSAIAPFISQIISHLKLTPDNSQIGPKSILESINDHDSVSLASDTNNTEPCPPSPNAVELAPAPQEEAPTAEPLTVSSDKPAQIPSNDPSELAQPIKLMI
ncbi:hypothetical protein niasHT_002814 [Heterodera trifolii]|uniref:Uncharacterized protein n=1 Tax=Heterodera trifolii TaxID=157864 RepID=A0ABD2MC90_9BILA